MRTDIRGGKGKRRHIEMSLIRVFEMGPFSSRLYDEITSNETTGFA